MFSQCFGNCYLCVPINSRDYYDGAFTKLKYFNSYDYIFNPVLFIISLESSHFGFTKSIPVLTKTIEPLKK